jgi:hypothetical protein
MGVAKELVASIDTCAARAGRGFGSATKGTRRDIVLRVALDLGLVVQDRVQQ